MPEQMIKVWDPIVRVLHWLLVALFVVAWQSPLRSDLIHEWSGYACVAVVLIRIAWGFVGTHHARFKSFLVSPRVAGLYIRSLLDMRPPRHIGHNPLGGWMIVALIAVMVVICVTGWMFTTDRYWGVEWVRTTHEIATDVMLGLIVIHVAANIIMSVVHRENLIVAMWNGWKRPP